jgi:addiction module HigA family antidote
MAAKSTRSLDRDPSHPGELLREIVLPNAGIPVSQVAQRLHVSRQTVHRLLAESVGVTPAMALRLSRLFGSTPDFWLRMQQTHDLWHQSRAMAEELKGIEPIERAA